MVARESSSSLVLNQPLLHQPAHGADSRRGITTEVERIVGMNQRTSAAGAPSLASALMVTSMGLLPLTGNLPGRDEGQARKGSPMVSYKVVDEAVIAGTPQEIADAYADEAAGRSAWWMPTVQMRSQDGRRPGDIGAIVDYRVAAKGRAARPGAVHFTARVTASVPDRIETEFIEGAFRGRSVLTTEPLDEGHTKIRNDWQTQTHGILMGVIARLMDIERGHSQAMQKGFAGLETYIAAVRTSSPSQPPSGEPSSSGADELH